MKRALVPAGVLVLLVALSGCVSVETSESRVEVTPGASGTYGDGDTTVVVEPLTAETPDAAAGGSGEAAFLDEVRAKLRPDNVIPDATDAQLLSAGQKACERLAAGEPSDTISVIEGEQLTAGYYRDSVQIIQAAATTIC